MAEVGINSRLWDIRDFQSFSPRFKMIGTSLTFLTLLKSFICSGMLAMPYCVRLGGIVVVPLIFIVVIMLIYMGAMNLVQCKNVLIKNELIAWRRQHKSGFSTDISKSTSGGFYCMVMPTSPLNCGRSPSAEELRRKVSKLTRASLKKRASIATKIPSRRQIKTNLSQEFEPEMQRIFEEKITEYEKKQAAITNEMIAQQIVLTEKVKDLQKELTLQEKALECVSKQIASSSLMMQFVLPPYLCMELLSKNKITDEDVAQVNADFVYGDILIAAFGPMGGFVANSLMLILQAGVTSATLVMIGLTISNLGCQSWDFNVCSFRNAKSDQYAPYEIVVISLLIGLIPLMQIRNFQKLKIVIVSADVLTFVCICLVAGLSVTDNQSLSTPIGLYRLFGNTEHFLLVFGIASYALRLGLVLPIESAMKDRKKYNIIFLSSLLMVSIVYIFFGFVGYVCWGKKTKHIILMNLSPSRHVSILEVMLCLSFLMTTPLQFLPALTIIEQTVFPTLRRIRHIYPNNFNDFDEVNDILPKQTEKSMLRYVAVSPPDERVRSSLRVLLAVLLTAVALFFPHFTLLMSILGSICCCQLCITLPALSVVCLEKELGILRKSFLLFVAFSGVVLTIWCTTTIFLEQIFDVI